MADQSMNGKVCMVTGATAGIGLETAKQLAQMGATVIIVGRNADKCARTVAQIRQATGNAQVESMVADLSALKQIRALAQQFKNQYQRLDVLVNNAGAYLIRRHQGIDGFELTFALNHLNYFLLTNLLLDTLIASAPSRIINISSALHTRAPLDFDDLQNQRNYGIGMDAYGKSKLANVLFTYELARRLQGKQVTVNAVHPGMVATNFAANNGALGKVARVFMNFGSISIADGAETMVYLASSPEVEGITGKYWVKKKERQSSPASYDEAAQKQLWQVSEEMVGVTFRV
jgi:NAD(P)-dependent dehydrogenase (short-subunit alcohol dehydrogenase family)